MYLASLMLMIPRIHIYIYTVIQKISVYAKIQTTNFSAPVVVKAGSN
jgi:hypothetical protein